LQIVADIWQIKTRSDSALWQITLVLVRPTCIDRCSKFFHRHTRSAKNGTKMFIK